MPSWFSDLAQSTMPISITSPHLHMEDQDKSCGNHDETIEFSVLLKKPPSRPNTGLGITIVGYVSGDPRSLTKDNGKS